MIITNDYLLEHENKRKEVWINAWSKTVSNIKGIDTKLATKCADIALDRFDERFSVPCIQKNKSKDE